MTLAQLIEAVEAGEYDRKDGPAQYLRFLHDCADAGVNASPAVIVDALYRGKERAAAFLRAMEGRE